MTRRRKAGAKLNGALKGRSNKRFDRSGINSHFIVNLNQFADSSRPVNRGVRCYSLASRQGYMNPLKLILTIKVVFTAVFWSLPLLFFPKRAAKLLGMPVPQPILFAHLLGAAFLALLVGYILGLLDLSHGRGVSNTVWVGVVSNGLAFLILLIFAEQWNRWGTRAVIYMWGSTAMTLLITLGLVVFGVVYN